MKHTKGERLNICFNRYGDCEGAMLRPGNIHRIAERGLKAGKYALSRTRRSRQHFLLNQMRIGLFVPAYNLGNFRGSLVFPCKVMHWLYWAPLAKLIKVEDRF